MAKRVHSIVIVIAAAALCASSHPGLPGNALHTPFKIRPGLWEFSERPRVEGDTIISDAMLARIPASQRAQYLSDTRRMLAEPSRERECISQATFEQRLASAGTGCRQTMVLNAPNRLEAVTECRTGDGDTKQESKRRLVASSPTNVTTSMHSLVTRQGKTMTIDSIEIGRWLGPSCGNLKGIEQIP